MDNSKTIEKLEMLYSALIDKFMTDMYLQDILEAIEALENELKELKKQVEK